MVKNILLLVFALLFNPSLNADRLGFLPRIDNPGALRICDHGIYVLCDTVVHHYSLDLKPLGTMAREGEGPGEIKRSPFYSNSMVLLDDRLFIDSIDKILYFSKEGKFLQERKKTGVLVTQMLPVGQNFVVKSLDRTNNKNEFIVLSVYNSNMEKIREIHRQISPVQLNSTVMIPDSLYFCVADQKIFVEVSPIGFQIKVFDQNGNLLRTIIKKKDIVPVSQQDKEEVLWEYKSDPVVKRIGYENLKSRVTFIYPGIYPPIQKITAQGNRLYLKTFKKQNGKEEFVVMDTGGEILKEIFMPQMEMENLFSRLNGIDKQPFTFFKNYFYYIKFNDTEEEYELFREKI